MSWSRRQILLGTAAAALSGCAGAALRNLVVVIADGGWDLTFTFDPKPDLAGVDGPYVDLDPDWPDDVEELRAWGDLTVTCNAARRPAVTRFFERWGHQVAAVRGVWVGSVSHWIGRRRILSGLDDPAAPDLVTRVGAEHARRRPLGAVDLSNVGRFGSWGRMSARGGRRGQLGQLLRPDTRYPMADGTPRPSLDIRERERAAIDAWLAHPSSDPTQHDARLRALLERTEARERAAALRARAGELTIPAPGPQGASGMSTLAASLLATRTCGAVIVDSGVPWDTHIAHEGQHAKFDGLFSGVDTLLTELDRADVLHETVVVVLSEMMRTPWRNAEGGTEHWPYTGVLLAGAGIAGGTVHGATDDRLVGLPFGGSLLTYDRLIGGILEHVGIDVGPWSGVDRLRTFAA